MATNYFQTGEQIARVAATMAAEDLGLAALVHRDVDDDFRAGGGKTVHIRVPGATTTSTRDVGSTEDYALGTITEKSIPVTLTKEAYSVVPVGLDESTLGIVDYTRQVVAPQALTVANHIENATAAVMADAEIDASIEYEPINPRAAIVRARAVLRGRGVPADRPLVAVAGPDAFADMLLAEQIDPEGRIAGVTVHENTKVPAGYLAVFVREAFAVALRAPQPVEDSTWSASVTEKDFPLTHMRAFNPSNGVTNSIMSTYVGVRALPLPIVDHEAGEVDLVDGAGVVRIDTGGAGDGGGGVVG